MRLKLLRELTTAKLMARVLLVEDTGDCPFHLVAPILARMSAKQLLVVERRSPILEPESDILWLLLIEKDFPNRPCPRELGPHHLNHAGQAMPFKALYERYAADRDALQRDLTDRLRRVTEMFRLQKLANKIVAVPHHLRDPSVRRRHRPTATQRNSILNKARRDLEHRQGMFRTCLSQLVLDSPGRRIPRTRAASSLVDAECDIKSRNNNLEQRKQHIPLAVVGSRRNTRENRSHQEPSGQARNGSEALETGKETLDPRQETLERRQETLEPRQETLEPRQETSATCPVQRETPTSVDTTIQTETDTDKAIAVLHRRPHRKRPPPAPSIFLQCKRRPPLVSQTSPRTSSPRILSRTSTPTEKPQKAGPSRIKSIRSSIFS